MSSTYFSSLSGMLAASYGLQNTSNNIANMQSPGFKRTDVFYSSLGGGNGEEGLGTGVRVGNNTVNFSDGNYMTTDNATDLAIVGQGFFVVRLPSGDLAYTRGGQFIFNSKGILIDQHSQGEVMGYNSAGNLTPIHAKGPQTCPGKQTKELFLKGTFVPHEKTDEEKKQQVEAYGSNYKNITFDVPNVYDSNGKAHKISFEFQSKPGLITYPDNDRTKTPTIDDNGLNWELVSITCDDAEVTWPPYQNIEFLFFLSGPSQGKDTIQFSLNGKQEILLNFGPTSDDLFDSVELKKPDDSDQTEISVQKNDGYSLGKQTSYVFDENGLITYKYDNDQNIKGIHLGLASFDDLQHSLVQTNENLFKATSHANIRYGRANQSAFGSILTKQLEKSNVDSTIEFANIVILQRMFQACSQIMDIDKQLLEGLEAKS